MFNMIVFTIVSIAVLWLLIFFVYLLACESMWEHDRKAKIDEEIIKTYIRILKKQIPR
jgi:hypothetical protein